MAEQQVSLKITTDATGAITGINGVSTSLKRMGSESGSLADTFKKHWLGITAAIGTAMIGIKKAWDLADMATQYEEQMGSLDALARKYNTTADTIVRDVKEAANGLLSFTDAANMAGKALMMGLSPDQLTGLTRIAEATTNVTGQKVAEAYENLVQAAAAGKQKSLKQMGIMVDLDTAYGNYAVSIGKAKDELTDFEKQQAGVNAILAKGEEIIKELGGGVDSNNDKMERFTVTIKDAQLWLGQMLVRAAIGAVGAYYALAAAVQRADAAFQMMFGRYDKADILLQKANKNTLEAERYFGMATASVNDFSRAMGGMKSPVEEGTKALEHQVKALTELIGKYKTEYSKTIEDVKKRSIELFDIKMTTGDLVSQVKQTLMDPFDKYNEQVRQLRDKEDMAMKLSSDEKIKLLQSVQQQWAGMTGEIKVGETVWKTAQMTASTAIRNIENIGTIIEQEKQKQIDESKAKALALGEDIKGLTGMLDTLQGKASSLTLDIDISSFEQKITIAKSKLEGLQEETTKKTEQTIEFLGKGSEVLPISDKISQIKDQLGSLATDASYNLDLSSFTAAANMMYSITSQMKTAQFWGATDLDWMQNIVGEIEQAMSLSIAREQVAYQKERLGLEELTGIEGSYQSGISYVPKTGLYRLHEGEQVITARETSNNDNRNYRTINVSLPSIQVIARDSDDPRALARKIAKPLQKELKRLEAYM
jgi:hypothetical protein